MRLLSSFLRHELLLQARSLRFRLAVLLYVGLCALPPGLTFVLRQGWDRGWGAETYLAELMVVQPFLTVMLAVLVVGQRADHDAQEQAWPVLAAAPMSSSGFLVRRFAAAALLLVVLSAVPVGVAGFFAIAASAPFQTPLAWLWTWLLIVVPLALTSAAAWLGWTTVVGSELGALAVAFFTYQSLIGLLNQVLLRFRLTLEGLGDWLGLGPLNRWFYYAFYRFDQREFVPPSAAATAAPYDVAELTAWMLPRIVFGGSLALAALFLAIAFVRRTRPDLEPRPIRPDHPLRTFLPAFHRFRQRHAPDAALSRSDRLGLALGALVLTAALAFLIVRQQGFQKLAAERYRTEMEHVAEPLPETIVATTWKIDGRLSTDGGVELAGEGSFLHGGREPLRRLPMMLNAFLHLDEVGAEGRRVTAGRFWDRLILELEPPLLPGEDLTLRWRASGVPSTVYFPLLHRGSASFVTRFEGLLYARFPDELSDLSRSITRRKISPRRIVLDATDLTPVPRHTPWTLTPPPSGPGERGREVPAESFRGPVDVELSLDAPPDWFLADVCGHLRRGDGPFSGRCVIPLAELAVRGGTMRLLPAADETGEIPLAALPAHQRVAAVHRQALSTVAALSDRAWPGLDGLGDVVAVEWPPAFDLDLRDGMGHDPWRGKELEPEILGRLLLLSEGMLIQPQPIAVEDFVAQLLVRQLLSRRAVRAEERALFLHFFKILMLRRMGLAEDFRAAISVRAGFLSVFKTPLLEARSMSYVSWDRRLPAVLVDLENRVGSTALHDGIEAFLGASSTKPGEFRDLLRGIEERAGTSLERFYEDYFTGHALPSLRFEEVSTRRDVDGFRVVGRVRNTGTGEAVCPIFVKGETSDRQLILTVDGGDAVAFSVVLDSRPHTVLLDPEGVCHRLQTLGSAALLERVDLLGGA